MDEIKKLKAETHALEQQTVQEILAQIRDPKKFLANYKTRYGEIDGAALAFWVAVDVCHLYKISLPAWANEILGQAATQVLSGKGKLHERTAGLLFPGHGRGRNATAVRRYLEDQKKHLIRAALTWAEQKHEITRENAKRVGRLRKQNGADYVSVQEKDGEKWYPLTHEAMQKRAQRILNAVNIRDISLEVLRKEHQKLRAGNPLPEDEEWLIVLKALATSEDNPRRIEQNDP
ncbi:MAG: hypothetical protein ACYCVY_12535 [Acidiferrobacteraceae bacterium]